MSIPRHPNVRRWGAFGLCAMLALSLVSGALAGPNPASALSQNRSRVIILLRQGASSPAVLHILAGAGAANVYQYHLIPAISAEVSAAAMVALQQNASVRRVVSDRQVPLPNMTSLGISEMNARLIDSRLRATTTTTPTIPEETRLTHAYDVQQTGNTGQGVKVAVIDSGLDTTNPDLANVAVLGSDGQPLRADFTGTDLVDTVGHGTACASQIAAQGLQTRVVTNTLTGIGTPVRMLGMAPDAKILSAKIFDTRVSSGWDSEIIRALEWAVDHGANIVSESFGGLDLPQDGQDPMGLADQAAVQDGVFVAAAMGNDGPGSGTVDSPADNAYVTAVGASTNYEAFAETGFNGIYNDKFVSDNVKDWSNRGPTANGRFKPDVMAPGAFGWADFPEAGSSEGADFGIFGGTSAATPVLAGNAALVLSAYMTAHPGQAMDPLMLKQLLGSTADDLGYPAEMQGGGRVNSLRAIQTMMGSNGGVWGSPNNQAATIAAGKSQNVSFTLNNNGKTNVKASVQSIIYTPAASPYRFQGVMPPWAPGQPKPVIPFTITVPAGTNLMMASVNWADPTRRMALRTYFWDTSGNFYNYGQTGIMVDSSGALFNQGHHTETYIANAKPGSPYVLDVAPYTGLPITPSLPFQGQVTFLKITNWPWATLSSASVNVKAGGSANVTTTITVPAGTTAGAYFGMLQVNTGAGSATTSLPIAVTVPVKLTKNTGTFTGAFTGSGGEYYGGEFRTYNVTIPAKTSSLMVTLQTTHTGDYVHLFLIDPDGAIMTEKINGDPWSNNLPSADQAIWANPTPGVWQVLVWAQDFFGGAMNEPFTGKITLNATMVKQKGVTVSVTAGGATTATLSIHNLGVAPLNVATMGETLNSGWTTGPMATGVITTGSGPAFFQFATMQPDATAVVANVTWDNPSMALDMELSGNWYGYAQGQGQPSHSRFGSLTVGATGHLAPGPWYAVLTYGLAGETRTVNYSFMDMIYGPMSWNWVAGSGGAVNPGQTGKVIVTVSVPAGTPPATYHGALVITTSDGDLLAKIPVNVDVHA